MPNFARSQRLHELQVDLAFAVTVSCLMVECERFTFVELPRTGSTHIKRLLIRHFGGRRSGMHEPVPDDLIIPGRYYLGTARNPWDWYASMWTIGCGRSGILHKRTTRASTLVTRGPRAGEWSDPAPWREAYADLTACDTNAFRHWLRLMHSPEAMSLALPGWYGACGMRRHSGYYSFVYAQLYCRNPGHIFDDNACNELAEFVAYAERNRYLTHTVRTERLADELLNSLADMGVPVDAGLADEIRAAPPGNVSHRSLDLEDYYDDESFALVRARERLIIGRHGYEFDD